MPIALVTGVAGFIGSHVAEACLRSNFEVIGIDNLSAGMVQNIPGKVEFIRGSILDVDLLKSIFHAHKIDYIFHFAAYPAENISHYRRTFTYQTNVIGSGNLINQAITNNIKCFVFASSVAVYGKCKLPMRESIQPKPIDPYGISKYAIELDLRAAKELFGLRSVSFRLHNVYGIRQNYLDNTRNVVAIFMTQLQKGEPLTIYGDGLQTRQFTYVNDITPIIVSSVDVKRAWNKVINLGSDTPISLITLAHEIIKTFSAGDKVIHLPERREVRNAVASHGYAKRIFGEYTQTPLLDGLLKMREWIVNDQYSNHPQKSLLRLEIPKDKKMA